MLINKMYENKDLFKVKSQFQNKSIFSRHIIHPTDKAYKENQLPSIGSIKPSTITTDAISEEASAVDCSDKPP